MKLTKILAIALAATALCNTHAVEVANSINQFTADGTQGTDGWTDGYRDYTADGGGADYDPGTGFIPFVQADHWRGAQWRLVPANAPWTTLGAETAHPNGENNASEHWVIRRWEAPANQRLAITYSVRKNANAGSGVSSSLHVDGVQVDGVAIGGGNTGGVTRTYFMDATAGQKIDVTLTPVGDTGDRTDGSDGSSFSMVIDDEVADVETQPDGTFYIAGDAVDSDTDGLADAWEEFYAPGDLTVLNGDGVADSDSDGLSDLGELQNSTNPVEGDSDMDGLTDFEEIDDAGTNPLVADTDGDCVLDGAEVNDHMTDPLDTDSDDDGFDDYEEVASYSDPNDLASTPLDDLLANSDADWSGVQGAADWTYGYRDYTADGGGEDYNATSGFIAFTGGDGEGAWDGVGQQWAGGAWDLNTAGAAPWTFLAQSNLHPNGDNNAAEHWPIRRWTGASVAGVIPVAITWHTRKANVNNDGVSGSVHVNGEQLDKVIFAGSDTKGQIRTVFANISPGTMIDLALSPEGVTNRSDGSDLSINWMRISTRIPENPMQPDGTPFSPATGDDTDADDLPDAWEEQFSPGDLTKLSGLGGADFDMDGLADAAEFLAGTDPTDNDSDDDGLLDGVETNDGNFVDATATGTSPVSPDTDGDGINDKAEFDGTRDFITDPTDGDSDDDLLSDGEEETLGTDPTMADTDNDTFNDGDEVARDFDPTDPLSNPGTLIADSREEFSGEQGMDSWNFGYRNLTVDGGGVDYDPATTFVPFVDEEFVNGKWDLGGGAPWTEVGREDVHPNGTNNTNEHWPTRRWTASELAGPTALGLTWHVRKVNPAGSGVTGAVHINGVLVDSLAIAGADSTGEIRTYYANVNPGDIIDLVLTPVGPGGEDADGADGSANWIRMDTYIPPNPTQPDGTPFSPSASSDFRITSLVHDEVNGTFTITWDAVIGRFYAADYSEDLTSIWLEDLEPDEAATETELSHTFDMQFLQLSSPDVPDLFFQVRDVTDEQ